MSQLPFPDETPLAGEDDDQPTGVLRYRWEPCDTCGGNGQYYATIQHRDTGVSQDCPTCRNTGRVLKLVQVKVGEWRALTGSG